MYILTPHVTQWIAWHDSGNATADAQKHTQILHTNTHKYCTEAHTKTNSYWCEHWTKEIQQQIHKSTHNKYHTQTRTKTCSYCCEHGRPPPLVCCSMLQYVAVSYIVCLEKLNSKYMQARLDHTDVNTGALPPFCLYALVYSSASHSMIQETQQQINTQHTQILHTSTRKYLLLLMWTRAPFPPSPIPPAYVCVCVCVCACVCVYVCVWERGSAFAYAIVTDFYSRPLRVYVCV